MAIEDGECQWVTIHGNPVCIKHRVLSESETKTKEQFVNEMHSKYPNLSKESLGKNYDKAQRLRPKHEKITHDYVKSLKEDFPEAQEVSGRVKTTENMVEKLGRKGEYKDVDDLTDVSGVRIVGKDMDEVKNFNKRLESNEKYKIVQSENYLDNDKFGYRSQHYILEDRKTGLKSEIQVRTDNQNRWADYVHDNLYKVPDSKKAIIEKNKTTFSGYTKDMSDYFYAVDTGNMKVNRPVCPKIVAEVIGCL
jgi:ppGpp synthetase/RelA/SpoT-type nucleotidyltranferase